MGDSERIGPYLVIQRLGAGGMGEVVLAHDDRLDRFVAIKRLHDEHAATPERRERLRREAKIVARLNHPAIVQLHDVLQQGSHDYLIMEYIEGRTLRERYDAGPMTVAEVLGIAHQIALGMAAAHDLGVIHRDLKAENILITPAGRAKVTDFGVAKLYGDDPLTAEGVVVGTFRAMSPEQAQGREIDHRSDLFSFGILLYEALTGVSPFRADLPLLTVHRLVHDDPQPIAELVPSIPSELARLIHQLLAKEPLLRPRDFHEVASALIELTGETRHEPCHARSSPGWASSSGEDTQSTGNGPAPAGPQPAGTSITAATREGHRKPTTPPSEIASPDVADQAPGASVPARPHATRRHRLRYAAAAGLAVMGALGIGYIVRDRALAGAPREPLLRVAVLDPSVSGADGRSDVALLAISVRNAVITGVRERVGLELVPRDDIDSYVEGYRQTNGRRPEQRTIRTAVGADEVLATHIECVPSTCTITLERDASNSSTPPPESFQLAADSAGRPDDTVAVHLSRLYPDHPMRAAAAAGSLDPRDYDRYVRLVQDYWAGSGALPTDKVLAEIDRIRERSPRSLDVLLFEADVLRHRYEQTKDLDQARRAMALLDDADKLLPDTYAILSARFDIALSSGKLDDAGAVLDRLATLDPDSSITHLQRAKLHYRRGELDRARGELAAAAQRDSFSWRVLYYRALVSKKLGDRVDTQKAIHQLLERSPGNYGGLSLLAHAQLDAGRVACAEQSYEHLVAREPLYDECLNLGIAQSQLGQYREAAASFRCALDIRPDAPGAQLDLAESLLLAGDTAAASAQLRPLHDLLARKRRDSPDGTLHGNDLLIEAQTLAYLGRDDIALAAAARERADKLLTPTAGPDALYTAALVHAFLRDRDMAAKYVTEYLDHGNSPAQFGYPWFDDLRRDHDLGPRLAVPAIARTCEAGSAIEL